jgi:hypothetical protein
MMKGGLPAALRICTLNSHPRLWSGERRLVEEFDGAASTEGLSGAPAELFGDDVEGGAFDDVGDLVAVRTDHHSVQVP